MHSKEKEDQEIQNDPYLIEFGECAEFKHVSTDEGCQKAASECKPSPNSVDFQFWSIELKCVELSRLQSEHVDLFIPNEVIVGKKLHPLTALPLVTGEVESPMVFPFAERSEAVSLIGFILSTPV